MMVRDAYYHNRSRSAGMPSGQLERDILGNNHRSLVYRRFPEGLGQLIDLHGQVDVYAGGLDPEDGKYTYAWWDDIGQIRDSGVCSRGQRHIRQGWRERH